MAVRKALGRPAAFQHVVRRDVVELLRGRGEGHDRNRHHGDHHGERGMQAQNKESQGHQGDADQEERPPPSQPCARAVAQPAHKGLDESADERALIGQQTNERSRQAITLQVKGNGEVEQGEHKVGSHVRHTEQERRAERHAGHSGLRGGWSSCDLVVRHHAASVARSVQQGNTPVHAGSRDLMGPGESYCGLQGGAWAIL